MASPSRPESSRISGMNLPRLAGRWAAAVLTVLPMAAGLRATAPGDAFLGRWALTVPGGDPGWLEVRREKGWYDGLILWRWGSVVPLASVTVADGVLTVTRLIDVERKDPAARGPDAAFGGHDHGASRG